MSSHQKKNTKFRPKVLSREPGGSSRPSRFQPRPTQHTTMPNPYYPPMQPMNPYFQPPPMQPPNPYYQQPPPFHSNDDFNPFEDTEQYVPPHEEEEDEGGEANPFFEEEEEEEEDPTQRRGKGKYANRARAKQWVEKEVKALVKAWIRISEDDVVGDQQRSDSFWQRILRMFDEQVGGTTRSHHQLNSKWNVINTKISRFNGIYIQMKNRWESGCSDADIMKKAQKEYRATVEKKGFTLVEEWEMLKDHPKWERVPLMGEDADDQPNPPKKSKTSESGNDGSNDPLDFRFNLNEDSPSGSKYKQRWKKPVGGTSSKGESLAEVVSQFKLTKDQEREEKIKIMKEQADRRSQREASALELLEMQKAMVAQDIKARDWDTYIKPHDNLHPVLLEHVLNKKRELAEKYGWPIYF